jgi:HK97 family phage major capsid protein
VFFNASTWLAQEAADAFAESESDKFINGDGINKPKGLLTYPTSSVADATRPFGTVQYVPTGNASNFAALTSTVNPQDVLRTVAFSMHPGLRGSAVWLMNSMTLATMKDYQGRFILQEATALGMPRTILGYPVVEAMHMPDIAANTFPIAFMNPRAYLIVDRIGTRVLVDPFSSKPNVMHYVTRRLGGAVQNSRALKLLKIAAS